ncbi:MAG: CRISPR system precrRNA processing endoribonuclease RAMP protein Cas6 [Campylobacterota bacterium]|nr:CRISPR system precrRNA processing endoribonuclease RAMP protein Cas6 [Campylobacterota bacterium]
MCINPSYKCEGCFASKECLYYDFYEAQNGYQNYRFEAPLESDTFDFSLFLFAKSCKSLPYVLSAIHKMLTEVGLMKSNLIFDTFTIHIGDVLIYDGDKFNLEGVVPTVFETTTKASELTLTLTSPLRIKKENRLLRDSVEPVDILRSIHQRYRQIYKGEAYAKLDYTPSYSVVSHTLHHQTLVRKSNRQKSKMNMDGIMGQIIIKDLDPKSYHLLKLGEVLGVGKQTVMGLGTIKVK